MTVCQIRGFHICDRNGICFCGAPLSPEEVEASRERQRARIVQAYKAANQGRHQPQTWDEVLRDRELELELEREETE